MMPPKEFESGFASLEDRLTRIEQKEIYGAWEKMLMSWGEGGTPERQNAERAFIYQLEHDPLYGHGKPAQQSSTWLLYVQEMDRYSASDSEG
jgi:hypothetical protein